MASNVNIELTSETKGLDKTAKAFKNVSDTIKKLNLEKMTNRMLGILAEFKGVKTSNTLASFFNKFNKPEAAFRTSNSILSRVSNLISSDDFQKLSKKEQIEMIEKNLPLRTFATVELQNQRAMEERNKKAQEVAEKTAKAQEIEKKRIETLKILNVKQSVLTEELIKQTSLSERLEKISNNIKNNKKAQEAAEKNAQKTLEKQQELFDKILKVRKLLGKYKIKDMGDELLGQFAGYKGRKLETFTKYLSQFPYPEQMLSAYNKRFADISNFLSEKKALKKVSKDDLQDLLRKKFSNDTYGNILTQIKKETFGQKVLNELFNKVKTIGAYYSVISAWNFMKDIIQVRKNYEYNTILISRALTKFPEFSGNMQSQNFGAAKNLIKELRGVANELGIEYGEIEKNFAKFANAVPKGSLSLKEVKDTYAGILKLFTVTGATAEEQTNALRAFTQMIEKGTLSAEEFNRQLGNTPLRSVVLEYGLKALNNEYGLNLKTFEEMQAAIKQKGLSIPRFLSKVTKEAAKDPRNKENLMAASMSGSISRLNNSIIEFKESLTAGWNINPMVTSITSVNDTLSTFLRLIAWAMPAINTFSAIGGPLYTAVRLFKGNKDVEEYSKTIKTLQDYHKEGRDIAFDRTATTYQRTAWLHISSAIWSAVAGLSMFEASLSSIKNEGVGFLNILGLIAGTGSTLIGVVDLVKSIRTLARFIKVKKAIDLGTTITKTAGAAAGAAASSTVGAAAGSAAGAAAGAAASATKSGGFWKGLIAAIGGLFTLKSFIIAAVITVIGILGYRLYKTLFGDEKKEEENRSASVSENYLVRSNPSFAGYNYAQVDVRADFPVQSTSVDTDGLSVNIFGSLQPGSNL